MVQPVAVGTPALKRRIWQAARDAAWFGCHTSVVVRKGGQGYASPGYLLRTFLSMRDVMDFMMEHNLACDVRSPKPERQACLVMRPKN